MVNYLHIEFRLAVYNAQNINFTMNLQMSKAWAPRLLPPPSRTYATRGWPKELDAQTGPHVSKNQITIFLSLWCDHVMQISWCVGLINLGWTENTSPPQKKEKNKKKNKREKGFVVVWWNAPLFHCFTLRGDVQGGAWQWGAPTVVLYLTMLFHLDVVLLVQGWQEWTKERTDKENAASSIHFYHSANQNILNPCMFHETL